MTRMVKKALTVLLSLCLIAAWLPATALAAAEGKVSAIGASVTEGTAQAGKTISQITVTATGGNFAASPTKENFSITGTEVGLDSVEISEVGSGGSNSITLTVNCIPIKAGNLTVTAQPDAFEESAKPEQALTSPAIQITAAEPPSQVVAAGSVVMGAEQTFTVTATGANFKKDLSDVTKFTLSGGGVTQPSKVSVANNIATLTVKAIAAGPITVTNIAADAFEYEPAQPVTSVEGQVTVDAPSGTVTASLADSGKLYAGTPAGSTKIKLTASGDGLIFADDVQDKSSSFAINGAGKGDLSVASVTRDGDTGVTLTLSGTPTQAGQITVDVPKDAFKYQPSDKITSTGVEVSDAPTVTLTGTAITAGDTNKVTITIQGESDAKFAASPNNDKFTITGNGFTTLKVTNVNITGENKTAELTLDATPTATGTMTVTVAEDAFEPVASAAASAAVQVNQPDGSVSGSLDGGSLTAGVVAGETKIKLTANGSLHFKEQAQLTPIESCFQLGEGSADLSINSVQRTDGENVLLSLTGTPKKGGSFSVTVKPAAFLAAPAEDKTAGPVTISPANVTLEAEPKFITEGEAVTTITLKATGSTFNATSDKNNFSLSGVSGINLTGVSSTGNNQATLSVSGTATGTGTLTITVQKEAFTYEPDGSKTATISVGVPSGTVSGQLDGTLYAGTDAAGQTVTITISDPKGLYFKSDAAAGQFTLEGGDGLNVEKVSVSSDGTKAVLTLSGTPTADGTFSIKIDNGAFKFAPGTQQTVSGLTINKPNVKVTVSKSELQAGEENKTFTLNVTGSKFKDTIENTKVSITDQGEVQGTLSVKSVSVAEGVATVTVSGKPETAGDLTVTIATDAFEPAPEAAVKVTVPVAKGEQKEVQTTESGAPGIQSDTPMDKLAAAVLQPDELTKFNAGAEVIITLTEKSLGEQVPAADKQAVEAVATGYTVGDYLDVSLMKQINGGPETPVTTTSSAIRVVFTIPEGLRAANREYVIARVHDNTATILKPVATTATTITVETDQFSTYAILYKTVASTTAPNAASGNAPGTGDGTPLLAWTALLLGCAAALGLTASALRRRKDRG